MRAVGLAVVVAALGCGRSPISALGSGIGHGGGDDTPEDDAQVGDDDGGEAPNACKQVDFLFVIDDSGSMDDNQTKLTANYETFIGGVHEAVEQLESFHLGVVTTDAYEPNRSDCDELGGLVVQTGGAHSSHRKCGPYEEGHSFMTEADDLDVAFGCAAKVGTAGSGVEAPMAAAIAAVTDPLTGAGACNEGFVREDALLVVVIVTDEDGELPPLFAAQALADAKRGSLQDIVVVVLGNPPDGTCSGAEHDQDAVGLAEFAALFPHGFVGPICADDYAPLFEQAVEVVRGACPSPG